MAEVDAAPKSANESTMAKARRVVHGDALGMPDHSTRSPASRRCGKRAGAVAKGRLDAADQRPHPIGRAHAGQRERERSTQGAGGHGAHEHEIADARGAFVPPDARVGDGAAIDGAAERRRDAR